MFLTDPLFRSLAIVFALLGLVMGSFGNVLIFRLPGRESIMGRSHCPRCKRTLRVWELLPVISFIFLGGKCERCKKPISWQYPLVELTSCVLFVLAFLHQPDAILSSFVLAFIFWILLIIALIDAKTGLIPDVLNLPLVGLCIIYGVLHPPFMASGVVLGGGIFLIQWIASRGQWIGSGDVILGTGLGALLQSWELTGTFLFLAYIAGGCVAAAMLVTRRKGLESHLAFGPFLAGAAIVTVLWGDALLHSLQLLS